MEAGSPADHTGLETGDILLTVGSDRIYGLADLETALYAYAPGDTVDIVIYRSGRQYTGTITVGEANG